MAANDDSAKAPQPRADDPSGLSAVEREELRRRAARRLRRRHPEPTTMDSKDLHALVQDLELHQVELEVQNDDLRHAQAELVEIRDRYLDLYEFAPVGYLTLDDEGRIRQANLAVTRLSGRERDKLIGKRIELLFVRADRDGCYALLRQATAEGENQSRELRLDCPDGRLLLVKVDLSPLPPRDKPAGFRMTLADVTDRARAEEALRTSLEHLHLAQEAAKAGSWEWNLRTNKNVWSEELWKVYGIEPHSVEPSYDAWLETIHPDDRARAARTVKAAAANGAELNAEWHVIDRDGTERWLMSRGRPLRDADGQVVRYIGIVMDITARKRAEEALRQAKADLEQKVQERTAELAQRAAQLRALAGELTLSEQRERRRMAKVLHDHIQQLLVGAKFRMSILSRVGDEAISQGAKEVQGLLDEAIAASRSLTAELSPPIVHEAGLSAGLEWLARWMADKHGLFVDLSMEQDLPALPEDVKVLLFESIRELLFNAVKHAHAGSANVNVRRLEGNELRITVSDTGSGFDPADIKPVGEVGGGFGLFSIRERLGLIGGRLEIDSAPGKGSRFVLTVPLAAAVVQAAPVATEAPARVEVKQPIQVTSPRPGAPIRVLLVDDHVVMREGLARLLGAEPDMEIVGQAADGAEAVTLAARLLPDVILMDLSMPRLNGVEATRAIHNDYPDIRIIGLSMFEQAERAQALRDAGAVGYLTKSGPSNDVIAAIRACMSGPSEDEGAPPKPRAAVSPKRKSRREES